MGCSYGVNEHQAERAPVDGRRGERGKSPVSVEFLHSERFADAERQTECTRIGKATSSKANELFCVKGLTTVFCCDIIGLRDKGKNLKHSPLSKGARGGNLGFVWLCMRKGSDSFRIHEPFVLPLERAPLARASARGRGGGVGETFCSLHLYLIIRTE